MIDRRKKQEEKRKKSLPVESLPFALLSTGKKKIFRGTKEIRAVFDILNGIRQAD
jgi:hypothetical protein